MTHHEQWTWLKARLADYGIQVRVAGPDPRDFGQGPYWILNTRYPDREAAILGMIRALSAAGVKIPPEVRRRPDDWRR